MQNSSEIKATRDLQLNVTEALSSQREEFQKAPKAEFDESLSDDDEARFDVWMRQQILRTRKELDDLPIKQKLRNAIGSFKEQVEAIPDLGQSSVEILILLLCAVPGWNEKNVQLPCVLGFSCWRLMLMEVVSSAVSTFQLTTLLKSANMQVQQHVIEVITYIFYGLQIPEEMCCHLPSWLVSTYLIALVDTFFFFSFISSFLFLTSF